jgi:hypothetical protein
MLTGMRGSCLPRVSGIALLFVAVGCASLIHRPPLTRDFTAERGVTLRGPADLVQHPADKYPRYSRGINFEGGPTGPPHETRILGGFECPRYDFIISWGSPDSTAPITDDWRSAPKREVQTEDDWPEPWTCSFECTITWLRPGYSKANPRGSDLRWLTLAGRAHTRRDRDEAVRVFNSIRFKPW